MIPELSRNFHMTTMTATITIVIISFTTIFVLARVLQTSIIFLPEKLADNFRFDLHENEEVFLNTTDGEIINALFFSGNKNEVVLYFHGNAGSLAGWQSVADDFTQLGYNFFIIDYRGYGKSTGTITELGLYEDGEAAYQFLVNEKGYAPGDIIIYGRSIGSGIAVELAARHQNRGLILEAPFTSLKKLASQKVPLLLPSLFLKYHFDNIMKINNVKSPVLFIHGDQDSLIPVSHTEQLADRFTGRKKKVIIEGGEHNDLTSFPAYHNALREVDELFK